jgi:hypothetical protein
MEIKQKYRSTTTKYGKIKKKKRTTTSLDLFTHRLGYILCDIFDRFQVSEFRVQRFWSQIVPGLVSFSPSSSLLTWSLQQDPPFYTIHRSKKQKKLVKANTPYTI